MATCANRTDCETPARSIVEREVSRSASELQTWLDTITEVFCVEDLPLPAQGAALQASRVSSLVSLLVLWVYMNFSA